MNRVDRPERNLRSCLRAERALCSALRPVHGIRCFCDAFLVETMQNIFTRFLKTLCDVCSARAAHLKVTWCGREGAIPIADKWHVADRESFPPVAGGSVRQIPIFSREEPRCSADGFGSDCSDPRRTAVSFLGTLTGGAPVGQHGEPERIFAAQAIEVSRSWRVKVDQDGHECRFEGAVEDFSLLLRIVFPRGGNGLVHRYVHRAGTLLALLEALIEVLGPPGRRGRTPADSIVSALSPPLLGESEQMREVRNTLRITALCNVPLLVEGESGTGKEIVARNAHSLGPRRSNPIVIINCLEVPPSLLQSELFGHLKGSFTGASRDRIGLVESAAGGTLFLDEIGEMPPSLQAALLRVLQEKEVRRIGESTRRKVDVRFVFATNSDLRELVEKGEFRRDLFYRISGIRIRLPSLRDRRDDIPLLARHFLGLAARECGEQAPPHITARALGKLLSYAWPGNVRELKNEMERVFALHPGARHIGSEMLSSHIVANETAWCPDGRETLHQAVRRLETGMIEKALERSGGNRTRAARDLGITRQGLLKKLKRYCIEPGRFTIPGR
jgi:DNA-binding NtrC family response regulator